MIRQNALSVAAMILLTVAISGHTNAQSGFIATNSDDSNGDPTNNEFGNPIGSTVAIPDFDPNLTNLQNTIFSTVTITDSAVDAIDNGGNIVDVFFTIEGLTHSHASDLTVRVDYTGTGANAGITRAATLFERVGITDGGSDTGANGIVDNQNIDGIGATSNFSGSYRFQDGGDSLFDVATNTPDGDVVPVLNSAGTGIPVYAATGANNGQVSLLSAFGTDGAGNALTLQDIVGTYEFSFSDRSNQTTNGDVNGIDQRYTRTNVAFQAVVPTPAIPEPGTASGMLLALIGLAARRRRS